MYFHAISQTRWISPCTLAFSELVHIQSQRQTGRIVSLNSNWILTTFYTPPWPEKGNIGSVFLQEKGKSPCPWNGSLLDTANLPFYCSQFPTLSGHWQGEEGGTRNFQKVYKSQFPWQQMAANDFNTHLVCTTFVHNTHKAGCHTSLWSLSNHICFSVAHSTLCRWPWMAHYLPDIQSSWEHTEGTWVLQHRNTPHQSQDWQYQGQCKWGVQNWFVRFYRSLNKVDPDILPVQ